MDFSEIGVKSRKMGLTAKQNVKRDINDMEDLDDFFNDDTRQETESPIEASNVGNGRMLFTPSDLATHLRTPLLMPQSVSIRQESQQPQQRPLLSPLLSHSTAMSNNVDIARPNTVSSNDIEDMDIDNDIYLGNNDNNSIDNHNNNNNNNNDYNDFSFDLDSDKVPIVEPESEVKDPRRRNKKVTSSHTNINANANTTQNTKRETLFVHSDSPFSSSEDHRRERLQQLESNTTIRSATKRKKSFTFTNTPNPSNYQLKELQDLSSSPSPIALKKASSITKNIALNKKRDNQPSVKARARANTRTKAKSRPRRRISYDSDESDSDDITDISQLNTSMIEDGSFRPDLEDTTMNSTLNSSINEPQTSDSNADSSSSDESDFDSILNSSRIDKDSLNRSNNFKRPRTVGSPSSSSRRGSTSREHVIDVNSLIREQRSDSRYRDESKPLRRSSRVKVPVLAFWRNEKAVYEKKSGDKFPTLKRIITVEEPEHVPRTRNSSRSRQTSMKRSTSKAPKVPKIHELESIDDNSIDEIKLSGEETKQDSNSKEDGTESEVSKDKKGEIAQQGMQEGEEDDEEDEEKLVANGELKGSEWVKNGYLQVDTFEGHGSDVRSKRLIAWAPGTENFSSSVTSDKDNFKLAILFDKNREFIATGMMLLPPGGVKSLKSTDTTYFVFYCISGIIEVTLSGNVFLIKSGCSIEIPMGNFYQFVNKSNKEATLFFVQTRGQEPEDDWDE